VEAVGVLFHGCSTERLAAALKLMQRVIDRGSVQHAADVICSLLHWQTGVRVQPLGEDTAAIGDGVHGLVSHAHLGMLHCDFGWKELLEGGDESGHDVDRAHAAGD
jgi:hypothetical protein